MHALVPPIHRQVVIQLVQSVYEVAPVFPAQDRTAHVYPDPLY